MAIKTFTTGEVLTAADTNTYLANSGLVYIKSQTIGNGVSSVTVTGAFSADYDSYKIVVSGGVNSTLANVTCVLGSTSTGYSSTRIKNSPNNGTVVGNGIDNGAAWFYFGGSSPNYTAVNADIYNPFNAKYTVYNGTYLLESGANAELGTSQGFLNNTTSYTSFTLSGGTFTGGTITVYGYRKA